MKYALITGGSRGIGRALCQRFAAMGYNVIINYLSNSLEAEKTLELVREVGGDGELLKFNVSNKKEVDESIADWQKRHEGEYIEVLVNNAGIRKDNLMLWMSEEEWSSVLGASLGGFFNVTQALLKNMLVKKYGRIINMASLSGVKGLAGQINYSSAKGGMIAATKALAQEVAKKGVTVNAVAPGFIKTEMTQDLNEAELKSHIPAGRFGEPEEVAAAVAFLASKEASYITGEVISINGGLYT